MEFDSKNLDNAVVINTSDPNWKTEFRKLAEPDQRIIFSVDARNVTDDLATEIARLQGSSRGEIILVTSSGRERKLLKHLLENPGIVLSSGVHLPIDLDSPTPAIDAVLKEINFVPSSPPPPETGWREKYNPRKIGNPQNGHPRSAIPVARSCRARR